MKNERAELLAPAGSYESFEAVLGAGADAVYVGGNAFGARAYAANFDRDELVRAIKTAHLHDRKLYLTVNTLVKNREMEQQLYEYLAPYYEAGLDAVLVQDFGVLSYIREHFPELPIHASTQMAVTGPEGMRFLEHQGLTRVVAARELSLKELSAMHQASPLEIESFVHGALCYCYSGRCLMSSLFGGRSGNRGRCAQPCRLPYQTALPSEKFQGGQELCPLSLKDTNTLELLPEILDAGVYSLKIEGRMKQPSYAAGVTQIYRKYLDLLFEKGADAYRVAPEDQKFLVDLFSRGGSYPGYYKTYNGKSMMAFSNEKKTGNVSVELKEPKRSVQGDLTLNVGQPSELRMRAGEIEVCIQGELVQEAQNQPMSEERVRQQMSKMGGTPFVWESLNIALQGSIFVPVKQLNELRRNAVEALEECLTKTAFRVLPNPEPEARTNERLTGNSENAQKLGFSASCETEEQLSLLQSDERVTRLYVPFALLEQALHSRRESQELFVVFPEITRNGVPQKILEKTASFVSQGVNGILVKDLESAAALLAFDETLPLMLDTSMYTWNDESLRFWRENGITENTVPLELNFKELSHRDNQNSEMIVYGYLPLMVSAQCVQKNCYSCTHSFDRLFLKDRTGARLPVQCVCNPWKGTDTEQAQCCYNIIYNRIPLGLLTEHAQVKCLSLKSVRLSFTMEDAKETKKVLDAFASAFLNGEVPELSREFTKGHFKRGVE